MIMQNRISITFERYLRTPEEIKNESPGTFDRRFDLGVSSIGEVRSALSTIAAQEGFLTQIYFDKDPNFIGYFATNEKGGGVNYSADLCKTHSEENPRKAFIF